MKIIISNKQFSYLIESNFRKEFGEIDIIGSLDRDEGSTYYPINDYPEEIDIHKLHDSSRRDNFIYNYAKKYGAMSSKILWRNMLNIENFNDVAYIQVYQSDKINVVVFDENSKIVIKIFMGFFLDGYQIRYTHVSSKYSGKKYGLKTYLKIVDYTKKPLYSDYTQSPESRYAIWYKLYQMFPNRVVVFIEGETHPIKMIDNEMYYDVMVNGEKKSYKVYYNENEIFNYYEDKNEREAGTPLLKLLP
jgi:hypothetical protein